MAHRARGPATASARVDQVTPKTCIDCHMDARARVRSDEVAARQAARSRRIGSSAATRGWRRCAATTSSCGACRPSSTARRRSTSPVRSRIGNRWQLPADGAPIMRGNARERRRRDPQPARRPPLPRRRARHPGHVDRGRGSPIAPARGSPSRGSRTRPTRATTTPTCCARSSSTSTARCSSTTRCRDSARRSRRRRSRRARRRSIRYAFVRRRPTAQLPLTVTARLRHRSRTLAMQAEVCRAAKTRDGRAFIDGAKGARSVALDPCKPQPITLIAEAHASARRGLGDQQRAPGMAARVRARHGAGRHRQRAARRGEDRARDRARGRAGWHAARDDPRAARAGREQAGPSRRRARAASRRRARTS